METFGENDYIGVTSLYPFCNKYGEYPIGHPKLITDTFELIDVSNRPYDGYIKCAILIPKKLFHPVLPYRSKEKMLMPLCAKCADTRQQTECTHSEQERMLIGCYVSLEIYKALEMGYKVIIISICFIKIIKHYAKT